MARLIHPVGYRFTSASGSVLASGSVETYLANTSTPQAIYQDAHSASALPNPTSLNASGQAQNASGQTVALFAPDTALKWVLKDATGAVVNTIDDDGGADAATGGATAADGGMRNLLSNGEMRLWLDTSTPVDWSLELSGATGTISRQAHTLGQTDVPGEPPYYQRLTVTASNADAGIYQDIDDVRTLAGQDAAASVYVRCSVTTTLRLALAQKFGTGGSPSTDVSASTDFDVSANVWTRLEMPKTLASIAGKTLGSNADSVLRFALTNPNNETFTLDVGGAQLERASEIGTLEKRLPYEDALLAARPTFATADINGGTIDATTIGATTPAAATVTSLNSTSPHEAGRNIFVNGGFDVWQRGTSVATADGYTADQWRALRISGSGNITVSQQALAAASGVQGDPPYAMRVDGSALSGATEWRVYSYVEDVRRLGGATVTLSFWAKASTGTPTVNAAFDQYFGSGGSTEENGSANAFVLSTSWQKFSVTETLASVSGKTIGAGSSTGLRISSATTALIDFAAVKLERGAVATPYVTPDPAIELARCQRYFSKSYSVAVAPGTVTANGAIVTTATAAGATNVFVAFSTRMRVAPTVTFYNYATGAAGTWQDGGATDISVTSTAIGDAGLWVTASGVAASSNLAGHWIATAEI